MKDNIYIEMEIEGINPFKWMNLKEANKKVKKFYRYLINRMKKEGKDEHIIDILRKVVHCKSGGIRIEQVTEDSMEIDITNRETTVKLKIYRCKKKLCLECNEESRAELAEKMNLIIEGTKEEGKGVTMLTIVAPMVYELEEGVTEEEIDEKFSEVLRRLAKENKKRTLKGKFCIEDITVIEEVAFDIITLRPYRHGHLIITFSNEEEKKEFQKKEEEFKEYVFRLIKKNIKIKEEKKYKKKFFYITKVKNDRGEEELITPKNGEYFRKSHNKGEERFKRWNKKRVEYFSQSENFDKEREVFTRVDKRDRKLIEEFYIKVWKEAEGGLFCLKEGELVSLGGEITKEDRRLKKTNYEKYKRVIRLKTYGVKKFLEYIKLWYKGKEEGAIRNPNVRRKVRISNNHIKIAGGAEEMKKKIRAKREEDWRKEKERTIQSIKKFTVMEVTEENEEVKEIAVDNLKKENQKEIGREQDRLLKSFRISKDRIDKEIIDRKTKIYQIGTELYNYMEMELAFETDWEVSMENIRGCFFGQDRIRYADGKTMKRLYELTEKYNLDRSQIYVSRYKYGEEEESKYFPKIKIDEKLDKEIETKIGITLEEYRKLWYYYSVKELEETVKLLIENRGNREGVKEILKRMGIK